MPFGFLDRIAKLRKQLEEVNLEAVLVTKRENYYYYSGFSGTSAYLVITKNKLILVTDFRYVEQANSEAKDFEVVQYFGNVYETIKSILKDLNIQSLGFEDQEITYAQYSKMSEKIEIKNLIPMGNRVSKARMVKDEKEIDIIRKAVEIADLSLEYTLKIIKPGISEIDVATELEYQMKKLGAKGPSFETIVASGVRSSLPHGVASEKKIEVGDAITIDFGAIYQNYCSDMTRTVFLGHGDEKILSIYEKVAKAQFLAVQGAKRGMTGKEIDEIARGYIAQAGYGNCFGHGLGHGVGLEIHEEPRLSMLGNVVMEDNMVVTVEPGIYIEGLGGVRIEDIIVIRGDKAVTLTSSTKDLIFLS